MTDEHTSLPPASYPASAVPGPGRTRPIMVGAFIFLSFFALAFALHHAAFNALMIYDSVGFIGENAAIFARHDLSAVIGIVPARPLLMTTFYANYLWTGMEPYAFRVCNAFFLAAAGMLLCLLIILILDTPGLKLPGTEKQRRLVGLLMGLWFLAHPLQSLVVLYIWQREAILACLFFFAGVSAYVATRTGRFGRRTMCGYAVTAILFLAGMLSKENVVTLPLVLLLADCTFLRGEIPGSNGDGNRGDGAAMGNQPHFIDFFVKRALTIALITVPPFLAYLLVVHHFHSPDATHTQGVLNRLSQYYRSAGLTFTEVVLSQCRLFFSYLATMVVPFRSGVQLIAAETISRSVANPPATMAGLVGVTLLAGTGVALVRRQPVVAFGILFSFITFAPESLLVPQYLFCGYRAILPMAGLLLIAACGFLHLFALQHHTLAKVAGMVAVITMLCSCAIMTVIQAQKWNPLDIWKTAYDRLPSFSRDVEVTPYLDILGSYGVELSHSEDYDAAIHVLEQAIQINSEPNNFKKTLAYVNKGLAHIKRGETSRGIESFRAAIAGDPLDYWPRYQLGVALVAQGDVIPGAESLRKAMELNPRDPFPPFALGNLAIQEGRVPEAVSYFRLATKLDPGSSAIHNALGMALEKTGDLLSAVECYRRAVELAPRSPELRFNLAKTLNGLGRSQEAIVLYQEAVALKADFGVARANLGTLLLRSGRVPEAAENLRQALELMPENAELSYQYGLALQALGKGAAAAECFKKALVINPQHAGAKMALERGE